MVVILQYQNLKAGNNLEKNYEMTLNHLILERLVNLYTLLKIRIKRKILQMQGLGFLLNENQLLMNDLSNEK